MWKELVAAGKTGSFFNDAVTGGYWIYDGTNFYTGDPPASIANKITYLKGTGTLTGKNTISLKTPDGKEEKHDAKKAVVISTGSRVRGLPQAGLELNKKTIISSDER